MFSELWVISPLFIVYVLCNVFIAILQTWVIEKEHTFIIYFKSCNSCNSSNWVEIKSIYFDMCGNAIYINFSYTLNISNILWQLSVGDKLTE